MALLAACAALAILLATNQCGAACLEDTRSSGRDACPQGSSQEQLLIQTRATSASVRRHEQQQQQQSPPCHTAAKGEPCNEGVMWAMDTGIHQEPHWYPGLDSSSSFEDFQTLLHSKGLNECGTPCLPAASGPAGDAEATASSHPEAGQEDAPCCEAFPSWPEVRTTCSDCVALVKTEPYGGRCDRYCESFGHVCVSAAEEMSDDCAVKYTAACDQEIRDTSDMLCKCKQRECAGPECDAPIGGASVSTQGSDHADVGVSAPVATGPTAWVSSGDVRSEGSWCAADIPADTWTLQSTCGGSTEVKVLSYNLYWWNLFQRHGGRDGSAGKLIASHGPFDLMGFQECEDVGRVLRDAGLSGSFEASDGGSALALAWRRGTWERVGEPGRQEVGEDRREQWYGKRRVHWVRLRHRQTGQTVFFANHHGPLPVNTGGICGGTATSFNILKAIADHSEAGDMKILVGDFNAEGGASTQRNLASRMHVAASNWVDAIFGSCPGHDDRTLGRGGSDHDALTASFRF